MEKNLAEKIKPEGVEEAPKSTEVPRPKEVEEGPEEVVGIKKPSEIGLKEIRSKPVIPSMERIGREAVIPGEKPTEEEKVEEEKPEGGAAEEKEEKKEVKKEKKKKEKKEEELEVKEGQIWNIHGVSREVREIYEAPDGTKMVSLSLTPREEKKKKEAEEKAREEGKTVLTVKDIPIKDLLINERKVLHWGKLEKDV